MNNIGVMFGTLVSTFYIMQQGYNSEKSSRMDKAVLLLLFFRQQEESLICSS
jgi:hypothetical protein